MNAAVSTMTSALKGLVLRVAALSGQLLAYGVIGGIITLFPPGSILWAALLSADGASTQSTLLAFLVPFYGAAQFLFGGY